MSHQTTQDLAPLLAQEGTYTTGGLQIQVIICNARVSWGVTQVNIAPAYPGAEGFVWVNLDTLTNVHPQEGHPRNTGRGPGG